MADLKPRVDVAIRAYLPSDQEGVEWLYSRTPPWGRTYSRPQPIDKDLQRIPERYLACFVAIEQDQDGEAVVGIAAIGRADHPDTVRIPEFIKVSPLVVQLHHVRVAPERWRMGIGNRLNEAAIDWARDNGYTAVILNTTVQQEAAAMLYRSQGFVEKGHSMIGRYELIWFELTL